MIWLLSHISLCFFLLQISHFNTEMAKLCDNVKTMQSNCRLTDDNKDLASLRKRTEDVASKLSEIKSATKVCHYTPVIHHHLQKWFFVMCTRYKLLSDCLVLQIMIMLFIVRVSGACLPLHVLYQIIKVWMPTFLHHAEGCWWEEGWGRLENSVRMSECIFFFAIWEIILDFDRKDTCSSGLQVTCRRKGDPLGIVRKLSAASSVWVS